MYAVLLLEPGAAAADAVVLLDHDDRPFDDSGRANEFGQAYAGPGRTWLVVDVEPAR